MCGTWVCTSTPLKRKHGREQDAKPVGLKWIDTNTGSAEASRYFSSMVCTEVRHESGRRVSS